MRTLSISLLALLPIILSCKKAPLTPVRCNISNTNNNHFEILENADPPARAFNIFCKKVVVFGVTIYATPSVPDEKILHTANVLAQYLDNNEDGDPDNQLVVDALISRKAFVAMAEDESGLDKFYNSDPPSNMIGQDLYSEETILVNGNEGKFDATLVELLHLITSVGYAHVYPSTWGEQAGSEVADAMDKARGGYFSSNPSSYPTNAWYHYDDPTCYYDCMVTEYVYWAITSHLGAQSFGDRCQEIAIEWELCTSEQVKNGDPDIFSLITDSLYALPSVLPDGTYMK